MDVLAKTNLAYVVGIALGDGNLSRPNKRATRLRVTCDANYPNIEEEIFNALRTLFPTNKVSKVRSVSDTYFNISVYSNKLDGLMPWTTGSGSKFKQNARVPSWIHDKNIYTRSCLRGLIQTDGSIYFDRSYKMINFTNNIEDLAVDVKNMMEKLGYKPRLYTTIQRSGNPKYTVRLSKDVESFIEEISLKKDKIQAATLS